jgi:hypothetical protein
MVEMHMGGGAKDEDSPIMGGDGGVCQQPFSAFRQFSLEGRNAATGFGMLRHQIRSREGWASGAKFGCQLIALDLVALQSSDQKLAAGGGDGHVLSSLWG